MAGIIGIPGRLQSVQAAGFARNLRPTSSECAGAKRHAAQLRDLFMKNAYEQMARDRLTLAEQVEWIDSIKEPSRRKPKE